MRSNVVRRGSIVGLVIVVLLALAWSYKGERFMQLYYHEGLRLVVLTSGLDTPWSLEFLPNGEMLVTERAGRLRRIPASGGVGSVVTGLPPIVSDEGGGLLGVVIDPHFAQNQLVYWSYVEPAVAAGQTGTGIAVARGRLEGSSVRDVQVIFRDPDKLTVSGAFGSRLVFAPDGRLLVTLGDRTHRDDAQRLDSLHGKIARLEADGSIPPDNPFVHTPGANPYIFALGFRDPQGIAIEPGTGRIWAGDHGPLGGDELDLIESGHNYGWPVVSYGVDEDTGKQIGQAADKEGMDPAALQWGRLGVPPTGITFLSSDRYPEWRNQLFVATLWGQALIRVKTDGAHAKAAEQQRLFTGRFERIRDVRQGPDGWLYVVSNTPSGSIVRLER